MARKTTPKNRKQKQREVPDRAFVQLGGRRLYLGEYGTPDSKQRNKRSIPD